MPNAYIIFHLNLAFSSIGVDSRLEVIQKCYWPLLELIERTGIPMGIELTGWTLRQIELLDEAWVKKFRAMLQRKQCELIGSGWSQIIGPLVPYEVNGWNQRLGLDAYQSVLDERPSIALVNEMAFSTGMVEVYAEAGYQGIVMDRDNVRLALGFEHSPLSMIPTHAQGCGEVSLPVLWSDSILFQRLQRVVHGDIPVAEYVDYIKRRIDQENVVLPIYCNDAEIFDYRPGRFAAESRLHPEGEWQRFKRVLECVHRECDMNWISPSEALAIQTQAINKHVARLTSIVQPIPVKKQAKYNINRWAVTGRDDLWLNTSCYQLYRALKDIGEESSECWREICELWASDLRTHITDSRWQETLKRVSELKAGLIVAVREKIETNSPQSTGIEIANIEKDADGILWTITTPILKLVLNVRRGLAIHSLAFASQKFIPVIGTLSQGFFDSIDLGVDFYSGGVLIEIPGRRARLTDLEWVGMQVKQQGSELSISAELSFDLGVLRKTLVIDSKEECFRLRYDFEGWTRPLGSVRVGKLTFRPETFFGDLTVECVNGGYGKEMFSLDRNLDYGRPASVLVSSSTALGCVDGRVVIRDNVGNGVELEWQPDRCAPVVMLQHVRAIPANLTRLWFSLVEFDDTSKMGGNLLPFEFCIKPLKKD